MLIRQTTSSSVRPVYWEVAIKVSVGKYPLNVPFETFITQGIDDNEFDVLLIEPKHAAAITNLPFHHRDPFDRLIIGQKKNGVRKRLWDFWVDLGGGGCSADVT